MDHKPNCKFSVEKRIECVTKYLALGNLRLVADLTKVSYSLIRAWKGQPWWKELEAEIRAAKTLKLDNKLSKIVDLSLNTVSDRMENGDFVFNQKTGEVVRKPVSLKDATKVASDLLQRQAVIQKQEQDTQESSSTLSIQDQLKMLATEFAKFNRTNTGPVEDAKVIQNALHEGREARLQEGSERIHLEASSEEEEGLAERSTSGDGESWESSQGRWEGSGSQESSESGWDELEEKFEGSTRED